MSRYIDAYEVKRQIQKATEGQNDVMKVFLNAMCSIDKIPPADVRENVRGEWIDRGKDMMIRWQCSECGRRDTHIYNFCPNCGADMRGE